MPDPSEHTYWLSAEARKLFAPKGSETVLEGIYAQIKILQEANEMHMSHQNVLDNQKGQTLDEDSLTSYQVWATQQRCAIICLALTIVKEKMSSFLWEKCFELAIQYASAARIKLLSRPRTVMEWYRCFRSKQEFVIP
jgi:hypothetical protein